MFGHAAYASRLAASSRWLFHNHMYMHVRMHMGVHVYAMCAHHMRIDILFVSQGQEM